MNIALLLSGGVGTRLGTDIPKQYVKVGGRPVFFYCLETLCAHDRIDAVHIVAAPAWQEFILEWLHRADREKRFRGFSEPGKNRQLSILHGLEDIRTCAGDGDYVFIHDAARPLLSPKQITDCLDGVRGHDGLMPVLPMKDTVYLCRDGKHVTELLDRSAVYAGQAPEVFRLGSYYEANRKLLPEEICAIHGSTEPAVLAGLDIVTIPGDEKNFKITTREDLERFCRAIERESKSVL